MSAGDLLATREGLHVGYSTAANGGPRAALLGSEWLVAEAVAVAVLCDAGPKC